MCRYQIPREIPCGREKAGKKIFLCVGVKASRAPLRSRSVRSIPPLPSAQLFNSDPNSLAMARLLGDFGPQLGRPHADTLNGSEFANRKELRFTSDDGVWRVAFAFDPKRDGILLVAGDKSGGSEAKFYKRLIRKADARYRRHLEQLQAAKPARKDG